MSLQFCLNGVCCNFMILNPDKCSFMLLDVNDELQTGLAWEMNFLKIVNKKKMLDVTSDNKLHFAGYLVKITKNDGSKCNALTRFQKYMTTEQKTHIFFNFVFLLLLNLSFCCSPLIWIFSTKYW